MSAFRTALQKDPESAPAAYNLAVATAPADLQESIRLCRKAFALNPDQPKYGYTLGYFLFSSGRDSEAIAVLEDLIRDHPGFSDSYGLLSRIHQRSGNEKAAKQVLQHGVENELLPEEVRHMYQSQLSALQSSGL